MITRILLALIATLSAAQAEPTPPQVAPTVVHDNPAEPDPAVIFAPFTFAGGPNATRSGSGLPGPAYWQNRADYAIDANIEPTAHVLHGQETITYTNNSPDALDVLWVQLDQNIYRADSRAHAASERFSTHSTDGDVIESVAIADPNGRARDIPYLVSDTRMQLRLPTPLAPHGGKLRVRIAWHYTVPGPWGGRTAVMPTKNGDLYEIGQWFPRMNVYDDIRGWDTAPYLGQEFYCEYGDIDYRVTVPASFIVAGSGALLNPADVLTATERRHLAAAAHSDRTVMIRAPADITDPHTRPKQDGTLTWHFHMQNTRDVAFAASAAFAWDAARIDLPPVSPAPGAAPGPRLAMSFYPVEAAQNWVRSTEYVKHAIEYFSTQWFPYPWPDAVNEAGHGANMEYPAMAFDGIADAGKELFWVTQHELGHNWFPMLVGSNERRFGFMDEGFNTFIDVYASDHFNHGEFAPKRDGEYAPGGGNPVDEIEPLLADPKAPRILDPSDLVVGEKYRHPVMYFKPALGLVLLREQILGPDRFDPAFRDYIRAWAYKHPAPDDFFRLMDSEAGEDLSWFWRGWYANNWTLDIAVTGASYVDNDAAKGVAVSLRNRGRLVMPTVLEADTADGGKTRIALPVEVWMHGLDAKVVIPTTKRVLRIVLDPDHKIPDANRAEGAFTL